MIPASRFASFRGLFVPGSTAGDTQIGNPNRNFALLPAMGLLGAPLIAFPIEAIH